MHKAHPNDTSSVNKKEAYSDICKTYVYQTKLRDMQKDFQSFVDRKGMKKFHDALKTEEFWSHLIAQCRLKFSSHR